MGISRSRNRWLCCLIPVVANIVACNVEPKVASTVPEVEQEIHGSTLERSANTVTNDPIPWLLAGIAGLLIVSILVMWYTRYSTEKRKYENFARTNFDYDRRMPLWMCPPEHGIGTYDCEAGGRGDNSDSSESSGRS